MYFIIIIFYFHLFIYNSIQRVPVHAASSSFWDTGMRLCDVDSDSHCHYSTYAVSIARFGFGGVAAAALSLLAFVLFIPIRCICNGFGGQNPSYGVCMYSTSQPITTP